MTPSSSTSEKTRKPVSVTGGSGRLAAIAARYSPKSCRRAALVAGEVAAASSRRLSRKSPSARRTGPAIAFRIRLIAFPGGVGGGGGAAPGRR